MLFKSLYFAHRSPKFDLPAFIDRWRQHGANGIAKERWVHNVYWYAQCARIPDVAYPGAAADIDGIGYNIFFSRERREAHRADTTAQGEQELDELETFAEPVRKANLQGTEEQSFGDRNTSIRLFRLVWRAPTASHEDFWNNYPSPFPGNDAGDRPVSFFTLNQRIDTGSKVSRVDPDLVEEYGYRNAKDLLSDAPAIRDLSSDPAVARTLVYVTRAAVLYESELAKSDSQALAAGK